MFSRSAKNAQSNLPKLPTIPARSGSQGPAPARPESFPVDPAATTGISVIGNDLSILGEKITIISQNKILVDGHVRGDVHGKQVVISKDGSVTGKVCAERIEVRGSVRGSIRALTVKRSRVTSSTRRYQSSKGLRSMAVYSGPRIRASSCPFSMPKRLQVSPGMTVTKRATTGHTLTMRV